MSLYITGYFAAALALLLLVLSILVIMRRAAGNVSILHGDDMTLATRIRRQGNLTEYAPLVLILMGVAEMGGASAQALWIIGAAFLLGRIAHPFGLWADRPIHAARFAGVILTFLPMLALTGLIVWPRLAG